MSSCCLWEHHCCHDMLSTCHPVRDQPEYEVAAASWTLFSMSAVAPRSLDEVAACLAQQKPRRCLLRPDSNSSSSDQPSEHWSCASVGAWPAWASASTTSGDLHTPHPSSSPHPLTRSWQHSLQQAVCPLREWLSEIARLAACQVDA